MTFAIVMDMPTTHWIDKKLNTVFIKATGEISIEDLIEQEKNILQDPDLQKGFNTYADFSKAAQLPAVDFEKIKFHVEFVASIQGIRGRCKWAIFAPYDYAYTIASIFAELSENLQIKTKVFKNETEAKSWLGI